MIHLTPFAWRSGQTSSMLGGAQFKATLLAVKHLPAIYNAKRQIFLSQSKDGKQLFVAWSSQFSGAAHFFKFMYQGGQRQRTHSAGNYPLIGSPRTGSNILKCKSMLCTYTAQTLPLNRIPTRQGRLTLVPFCWAWKVAQTFKKGEAKSESFSKTASWITGFWSFLALSLASLRAKGIRWDSVAAVNPRLLGPFSKPGSP